METVDARKENRVSQRIMGRKDSNLPALSIMLHVVDCQYYSWFLQSTYLPLVYMQKRINYDNFTVTK